MRIAVVKLCQLCMHAGSDTRGRLLRHDRPAGSLPADRAQKHTVPNTITISITGTPVTVSRSLLQNSNSYKLVAMADS